MALNFQVAMRVMLTLMNNSRGNDQETSLLNPVTSWANSPFSTADLIALTSTYQAIGTAPLQHYIILVPQPNNQGTTVIAGANTDVGITINATLPMMFSPTQALTYLKSATGAAYKLYYL